MDTKRIMLVAVFAFSLLLATQNANSADKENGPKEIAFEEGKTLPPPSEGMAWCLVTIPAKFKMVEENVQISPATFYMETVAAKYGTKTERIMVAPEKKRAIFVPAKWKTETIKQLVEEESFEYRLTPAKYDCVEETVEVQEAYEKASYLPAVYKRMRDTIEVAPARTEERKADCKKAMRKGKTVHCYTTVNLPAEHRTICREELEMEGKITKEAVPARNATVRVRKMIEPPKAEKVIIPAKYKEITRQVLVAPATYEFETIPARYETIEKLVMTEPASQRKEMIPAKHETITRRELVAPEHLVWRECPARDCGIMEKYGSVPGAASESEK